MRLVELYATEVGKHLPAKNRADLEQEIRSLIEDAIEDEARSQGKQPDEELVLAVLRRFGPPADLAASYGKPNYLIGPKLFPFYWMVLRIVLAVILVVSAFGVGINLADGAAPGQTFLETFLEAVGSLLGGMIAAFGNVTLVFAILERFLPEKNLPVNEWDPADLKAEPDPQQVSLAEPIFETVFTLGALILLNVYPHLLVLWNNVNGEWFSVPFLTPAFFSYVPFISILLVVDIVKNALLLRTGRWTTGLRWFEIASNLAGIVLLVVMLTGPALVQVDAAAASQLGWDAEALDTLVRAAPALDKLAMIPLAIALAVTVWETITQAYRLLNRKITFNLPASR